MDEEQEISREEKIERYKEQKSAEKSARKRKTILWLFLVLLLIGVLLVLWQNRERVLPENAYENLQISLAGLRGGDGYPHNVKGNAGESGGFLCEDGNLLLLSDTAFEVLNSKGGALMSGRVSYGVPAAALSETRCLLYGIGEKEYQIEGIKGTIREGTTDRKLIAADISAKGKYILATESDSHVSEIAVYMPDGSLQYSYKFSSCYITDVSISSDGKTGAVCGIYSTGGTLKGQIYLFDFGTPEPVVFKEKEEMLFFDVEWNGTTAVCIGQTGAFFIGKDDSEAEYRYENRELAGYAVYGEQAAFVLDDYKEQMLTVVDPDGKARFAQAVDGSAKDVSLFGETAAVLTENGAQVFSTLDGSKIASLETGGDARRIALSDVNTLYILGLSQVQQEIF